MQILHNYQYFISFWNFDNTLEEGRSCTYYQRQINGSEFQMSINKRMGTVDYRIQTWPSSLYHISRVPSLQRMALFSTQRKQKVVFPSLLATTNRKTQQLPFKFCPLCATGTGIIECPKCEGRGKLPHLLPPVPGTRPKMGEKRCKTCGGTV